MMANRMTYGVLSVVLSGCSLLSAQEANPTAQPRPQEQQDQTAQQEMRDGVPVYRIKVVARDIPAVNYFHRSHATKIGFQGTALLPQAKGTAKVEGRAGRTVIDANFEGLTPANG